MIKKYKLLVFFVFFFINLYSQNNVSTVFKTLLILDGCIKEDNQNNVNDTLLLHKNIRIEIDEIYSKKIDTVFYPSFFSNYKVFSFTIGVNKIDTNNDDSIYFSSSTCNKYIIIYNVKNNRFYRIKGFTANDFSFLLKDIIINNENKIKEKDIVSQLDNLDLTDLDFGCIYKAINDIPTNINKYPCMNICTDAKPAHLSK